MKSTPMLAAASLAFLSFAAANANAQGRSQTWDIDAGMLWSGSLTLDGEQGTGLDVDDDLGFSFGGNYNFNEHWALGFSFDWLSPRYDATYVPDGGGAPDTLRTTMDVFTISGRGTYYLLDGPITPYAEVAFGWTDVDSNVADGPPFNGCWWDPWWGYICAPFYSTYGESLTSWSAALGVRWDINRMWGVKASYGRMELDTSSWTEDATLDLFTLKAVFRY